jgi:3-oxoacyl-(acyl-carrier-protein) synthase
MELPKETEHHVSILFRSKFIANMASGMISMKFGLQGINFITASAVQENTALMDAFNYIRLGKAKVIVSGGSEAAITRLPLEVSHYESHVYKK